VIMRRLHLVVFVVLIAWAALLSTELLPDRFGVVRDSAGVPQIGAWSSCCAPI
jgi:hypothetical protein